jgi:hypothetical protein
LDKGWDIYDHILCYLQISSLQNFIILQILLFPHSIGQTFEWGHLSHTPGDTLFLASRDPVQSQACRIAKVGPNSSIAVVGASGGTGSAVVQVARALGRPLHNPKDSEMSPKYLKLQSQT